MSPRVTVLLPVYNGMPFLISAVESILAQTYQDFELLVLDDGSTDESCSALRKLGDPRIRIESNGSNLGLIRTLNRGLELASGEYIARIDQTTPHSLTALLSRLRTWICILK